jgi:hypothetical protein
VLELGLLGGDLVARGADPQNDVLGLVAQRTHAVDDVGVLLLDPLQVLEALHQVRESLRLEQHGQHVGSVCLVDLDEAVAEHVE